MQNAQRTLAPIALFVYNRLDHTQKTIEALLQNEYAHESDLFIFSDGAKIGAEQAVEDVRSYVRSLTGFRSVTTIERPHNFGLARSIIGGVTHVLQRFGRIIVVEDDLITSPHFLRYMNDGLETYKDTEDVISIHGYTYPVRETLPETFFLLGANCWGWATWKRGWELFEQRGAVLLQELEQKGLKNRFNFWGTYNYTGMLERQIAGTANSWAILWYASAMVNQKVTLYPGRSLVHNIGFDGSGIHGSATGAFNSHLSSDPIVVSVQPARENDRAAKAIAAYFQSLRPSYQQRVIRKVRSLLKKLLYPAKKT